MVELRTRQLEISQTNVEILQLQRQQAQWQNELVAISTTALKDSGVDETKYQLDPNTFAVTEKPPTKEPTK